MTITSVIGFMIGVTLLEDDPVAEPDETSPMSWQQLPPHIRTTAELILTRKQLDVFKLTLAGLGTRRISDMLLITRSTVRSHQHDAHTALEQAGIRRDASGNYYTKEAA